MQGVSQRQYWSGKVGDDWATLAERIDAMFAPLTKALLNFAALRAGERVLDIGCGSGAASIEIAGSVGAEGSVVGVDLSPQMLKVARERAAEAALTIAFEETDVSTAKFDEPFDAAMSRFGVMFFEAPIEAFSNIRANVRNGGRIAFACWRPMAENAFATVPLAAIQPMLKTPLEAPDPSAPGPYSLADDVKVERILRAAGWRNVLISRWDGKLAIAGGGRLGDAVDFLMRIGPCARAIADQELDAADVKQHLMDYLAAYDGDNGVALAAACWLVSAEA